MCTKIVSSKSPSGKKLTNHIDVANTLNRAFADLGKHKAEILFKGLTNSLLGKTRNSGQLPEKKILQSFDSLLNKKTTGYESSWSFKYSKFSMNKHMQLVKMNASSRIYFRMS